MKVGRPTFTANDAGRQPGPGDDLTGRIWRAIEEFIAGRDDDARKLLRADPEPVAIPRVSLSPRVRLRIYGRDGFRCRYCERQTLFEPALRLLSTLAPDDFPYHPNWKRGSVHPVYPTLTASCDHLVPVTRGGAALDPVNLVTACARCQYAKGDYLLTELQGYELQPCEPGMWDGLTGVYPQLYELTRATLGSSGGEALGKLDRSHRPWLLAVASKEIEELGP
jgi:hypothetical protein